MEIPEGYVSASQAARRLGLSKQRVHQFLNRGRIRYEVVGCHRLIKLADLERFASVKRTPGRVIPFSWND